MRYIAKLAFKNLFRHKLRTLVSIIAIAFSVMIVIFARGFIVGMIDHLFSDHIHYNSGHIKIINKDYQQQERLLVLDYPVNGFNNDGIEQMITRMEEIEDVEMAIPRLKFGAMATAEEEVVTMSGWGVRPDKEISFTNIEDLLAEGRMVTEGKMEIIMGTALLNKLNHQVGDKITILYNNSFNSLQGATFKIVGRIKSGLKMLNEIVFYLPLDQAQRILYMEGEATELLLVAKNREHVNNILPEVKKLIASQGVEDKYLALGFRETSDLIAYMEIGKIIYNTLYIFLVLLASFVVINTMMMIVKERTKEIGMMSAFGLNTKNILYLFIVEGALMGTAGSLIGSIVGGVLNNILADTGINFSDAMSGVSSDIMFNSIIYPVSTPGNTIFAFVLGVIVVTVACIIPARRAAKLEPTEALREI